MTEKDLTELVKAIGQACGFSDKENGFFRDNKKAENGSRYFGFISKGNNAEGDSVTGTENTESSRYWDFSLVFFPDVEGVDKSNLKDDGRGTVNSFLISLGVGTNGFAFDQELASHPGTRRHFLRLHTEKEQDKQFFKNDFTDITTNLVKKINGSKKGLKPIISSQYSSLLQAGQYVDLTNSSQEETDIIKKLEEKKVKLNEKINSTKTKEDTKKNAEEEKKKLDEIINILNKYDAYLSVIIGKWIATYAKMRDWGTAFNKDIVEKFLPSMNKKSLSTEEIYKILNDNHFIVLQGAPGTGKTWSANEVAKKFKADNVLFEQFHAETTYSDFIYGIRPTLSSTLGYEGKKGVLLEAIEKAEILKDKNEKVLLIIDEINRANLSNVLGPVFYLFEKGSLNRTHKMKVGNKELEELPENLYVIATMNTADRSLAVVDFALRRRFTWLTLKPHEITVTGKTFMRDYFNDMASIFEEYATDEELNLQPGQSYYVVDKSNSDNKMKERLKYELMPLVKEYLNEGYLASAKEVFCNYFYQTIGELMYE